jgi:hypothetical protein
MPFRFRLVPLFMLAIASPSACSSPPPSSEETTARHDAITSVEAKIVDFGFDAEILAAPDAGARDAIVRQLLYSFGILRTSGNASGQIGNVRLSDVRETTSGDKKHIAYRAWMPVAWPKDGSDPSTYELTLPRDVTALEAFDRKYDGRCGHSEHGSENYWHDFNPRADGCGAEDADVVRTTAAITRHAEPEKKFPEYERIWEDGRLDVTAIFTIIDKPERQNDWAYTEAGSFVAQVAEQLRDANVERHDRSGSILVDTTVRGRTFIGGSPRDVQVDALVIDDLTKAGSDFDQRYDALSENADLVLFNGHARLGANTKVLGQKGRVVPSKYQLFLLNACDTFALADVSMTDRRHGANGDSDPNGTRFLDVISNARPGRSDNLTNVSMEVYKAALRADDPQSYDRIIDGMPSENVVVVFGEEDNGFFPARSMPEVYAQQALGVR